MDIAIKEVSGAAEAGLRAEARSRDDAQRERPADQPLISVVVPTKNEAGNVTALVERLEQVLPTVAMEIIFVDASDDGTREAIEAASARSAREIVLLAQAPSGQGTGLGAAVIQGMRVASGEWVCVMDADLQHPPELIADLLEQAEETDVDLVLASRYCPDGTNGSFARARAAASRLTTNAARLLFPQRLKKVTDPMSGFFLVRRSAVDLDALRPRGFKILLEILVRSPELKTSEVAFEFGTRNAGESKASVREGLRYISHLGRLRFARFGVVGASGLVVNTLVLAALTDVAGLYYVASAAAATQVSTLWNFTLTELWVFSDREHKHSRFRRLAMFFGMNNLALALRGPILVLLTSWMGIHYLLSNILSLVALTLVRYALADALIWAKAGPRRGQVTYPYDIHGIISLESDVRLPELERFRVGNLVDLPTMRVRVGRLRQMGIKYEMSPRVSQIRYDEGMGAFGFGTDIRIGERIQVRASPLLRLSPHVLYTNLVEPILRWSFVERGYALVHGACIATGDDAFLITARTDTGKTTTILKTLDSEPDSFLSDDLTLVSPEGRVLAYPKPLTISRHTLKAVKTPLLSRKERLALIVQARLHSRSGRRFAMFLARFRLPAATINALAQLFIPPPKYHVERLVPGVQLASSARLRGMVVIQRGGEGKTLLNGQEALDTLMTNCEDAFGFPPYPVIQDFLHSRNGHDLRVSEREIVASALNGVPTTLVRSETMDWWERLPRVMGRAARVLSPAGGGPGPGSASVVAAKAIAPER